MLSVQDPEFQRVCIKNTFIDIDEEASDEEEGQARCRRGFVTCPNLLDRVTEEDASNSCPASPEKERPESMPEQPESMPAAGSEATDTHPKLLGAGPPADLQERKSAPSIMKVVVKNTFIEQEPAEPQSPVPCRRVTCPEVLPSERAAALAAFCEQEDSAESEKDEDDDDADPDLPSASRRTSVDVGDGDGRLSVPASRRSSVRRVSFPEGLEEPTNRQRRSDTDELREMFLAGEIPEALVDTTPAGEDSPRLVRGAAFDTQDMREHLLEGGYPELQPEKVPTAFVQSEAQHLRSGKGTGAHPGPSTPVSAAACSDPLQGGRSPSQTDTPSPGGVPLSLMSAVDGPSAPRLPAARPLSIATAMDEAAGAGSPQRPSEQKVNPMLSPPAMPWGMPMFYHPNIPMTWGPQPWCVGPGCAGVLPTDQQPYAPPVPSAATPKQSRPIGAPPSPRRPERTERRGDVQRAAAREVAQVDPSLSVEQRQETAVAAGPVRNGRRLRLWMHIYLHMQVPGFDLVPRLIGKGGANMKKIAEKSGAKIRIRGKGSGHLEIDGKKEAPTPLMIAVTTDKADENGFRLAIEMVVEELRNTEGRYRTFCQKQRIHHEGPCFSIGIWSDEAQRCLGDICSGIPIAPGAKRLEDCQ